MPSPLAMEAMLIEPRTLSEQASSTRWTQPLAWCAIIAASFLLDSPLAEWLRNSGFDHAMKNATAFTHPVKLAGLVWYTIVVALVLGIFHPMHWRAALFELGCALVAGCNSISKWLVGRFRPFKLPPFDRPRPFYCMPCYRGMNGLFHQASDLSFVSGHTALSFATAAGIGVLLWSTRGRVWVYLAYTVAGLVLIERVGENAHWLSDAVCAAALGVWGVKAWARMYSRVYARVDAGPWGRWVTEPGRQLRH